MNRWLTSAVLLVVLAVPAMAADFPKGTFTIKGPGDTIWSIKFDGKSKFSVLAGDMEMVHGTYKTEKGEIEFTDEGGNGAGTGDEKVGTYKWKLDGKKLTFTEVKDKATGRKMALTSGAWEKKD